MIRRLAGWMMLFVILAANAPAKAEESRNELGREHSPYLQLHSTDPVHWRAWSSETLDRAKAAGKPILLSTGYSSCHLCHVIRREAFSDPETAEILNRLFFPILLDREERPDIHAVYQTAAAALSLPTGWPLNMFLTPDAKPFWGGTYFPKEKMRGFAAFKDTLKQVSCIYADDPDGVAESAEQVAQFLARSSKPKSGAITTKISMPPPAPFLNSLIPFTAASGKGRSFPIWWRWTCCGGRISGPAIKPLPTPSPAPFPICLMEGSMIMSAAGFSATPSTGCGGFRTLKRCLTLMPAWCG